MKNDNMLKLQDFVRFRDLENCQTWQILHNFIYLFLKIMYTALEDVILTSVIYIWIVLNYWLLCLHVYVCVFVFLFFSFPCNVCVMTIMMSKLYAYCWNKLLFCSSCSIFCFVHSIGNSWCEKKTKLVSTTYT